MEKKNNKFEVTIIFIVIVFSIIMYGLYLVVNEYYKKYAFTLITSPLTILECKKWDCTDETSEVSKYNNKEYNTNIDGKDIGKNTMYYDSFQKRFYIFDYKDNKTNSYKLKVKFPKVYDSFDYQDIVEAIFLEVDSKQLIN